MNDHKFHFITGLPRSGTTLLAAILKQNPRFSADMSSSLYTVLTSVIEKLNPQTEFSISFTNTKRENVYRGIFNNFYEDCESPVIFDTNRLWSGQINLISNLLQFSKMIACIRNVSWIVDSFENIHQNNYLTPTILGGYSPYDSVYVRAHMWVSQSGVIGRPFDLLKQAYFGNYSENLLIVDYDSLVRNPKKALIAIHDFIKEDDYKYDFDNVVYNNKEYDTWSNISGLHDVRSKVEYKYRDSILPPDLFTQLQNQFDWLNKSKPNNSPIGKSKARLFRL